MEHRVPVVSQVQQMTTREIEIEKFIIVLEEVDSTRQGPRVGRSRQGADRGGLAPSLGSVGGVLWGS